MKIYPHYAFESTVNSYLIANEQTREALIIDPGLITRELFTQINTHNYRIQSVFVTHKHKKHYINSLVHFVKAYNAIVYAAELHVEEGNLYRLSEDCVIETAGFSVECFAVPGHTPDSYMFKIDNCLFTGDSLTAGLTGKTFDMASEEKLEQNIKEKIFVLEKNMLLFPGHGPPTTLEAELQFSTRFREYSRF